MEPQFTKVAEDLVKSLGYEYTDQDRAAVSKVLSVVSERSLAWAEIVAGILIAKSVDRLDRSIGTLTDGIDRSSRASERHARGLKCATWALVAVTVVLAVVTALNSR